MAETIPAWRRVLTRFGDRPFTRAESESVASFDEIENLLDIGMLTERGDTLQVLDAEEWERFDRELQG